MHDPSARPTGGALRITAPPSLVDAVAAVLLALLTAYTPLDPPGPAFDGPPWAAWLTGALLGLPVAVRRLWPLPVLALILGAAVGATVAGVTGAGAIWVTYVPVAFALYTAATTSGARWSVVALTLSLLGPALAIPWYYAVRMPPVPAVTNSEVPLWWPVELGITAVTLSAAWAAGRMVRWRRTVTARMAAQLAREAVADERLRIARELHDIIGHSMSLIAVKATVANHIAEERPQEAWAALAAIEHASRTAMTEIRRLLGVLRSDGDPAELTPALGTAELPALAERVRATGLWVDLTLVGTDDLPVAVDLTVYRIVQEALTNVLRHAVEATTCRVRVVVSADGIDIEVVDDGRTGPPTQRRTGGGHGLVGMRERVAMYGGTLVAGPQPRAGFRVAAHLPHDAGDDLNDDVLAADG
ncbi:sensor histidine kinase [Micromonospora echinospora]|uniref:sensor histidine kinase n=1 Tax=Micromonospora echinospora TaxID=1877 RepID=UPI003CF45FF5